MRGKFFMFLGCVVLLMSSTAGLAQSGGRGDPRGAPGPQADPRGPGARFPGGRDPNQFFNQMTNGKDVWIRSEIQDPWAQGMFDRMADRMGVTNGQITRQQYLAYQEQRAAQRANRTPGEPGAAPGSGGDRGRRANPDSTAEGMFLRLDQNGDGYLNFDEMPDQLRNERDQWDTDHNGLIDLKEFKAYFQARVQPAPADSTPTNRGASDQSGLGAWSYYTWDTTPAPEEERKPPVVYRPGKLPKELPAWFAQLDTDQDGQIGLYEWKASGRSLQEFEELDRNKDGFLTVDEVLRSVNKGKDQAGQGQLAQQSFGGFGFGQQGYGPNGGDPGFNRGWGRGGGPGGPRDRGGRNFGGRGGRGRPPRGDGYRGGNPYEGDY